MSYTSKPFAGHREPSDEKVRHRDLNALVEYLENELANIARAFQETQTLELRLTTRIPKRPQEGMIVAADGTSWNPGSGKGVYVYLDGSWVLLGGGLVANTSQTPFFVVDEGAQALLRELLVEQKVQTLILQTKLNFTMETDKARALFYKTIS